MTLYNISAHTAIQKLNAALDVIAYLITAVALLNQVLINYKKTNNTLLEENNRLQQEANWLREENRHLWALMALEDEDDEEE